MTITKKTVDILDVAHIYLEHNGQLYKVLLSYDKSNCYELWVYIAQKPHKKFKHWKKLKEYCCDIRGYDSLEEMIICKTQQASNHYWGSHKEQLENLRKWQEFIKNT